MTINDYDNDEILGFASLLRGTNRADKPMMNKKAVIKTSPHYSDPRFQKEQTVFGKAEDGLNYDYDDRLRQWDYRKSDNAWEHAKTTQAQPETCEFYEEYLSFYFGKPIEIRHIIAGVNRGNGYPYCVFGYKDKTE